MMNHGRDTWELAPLRPRPPAPRPAHQELDRQHDRREDDAEFGPG